MQNAPRSRELENDSHGRAARLSVYQSPRNPTVRERGILTLLAEGLTQKQAAAHLGLHHRTVTNTLGHMRERYSAATNEALIAAAVRLQWIAVAIDIHP
jgi:DNA-binding CsgD family transcriptional regulator